MNAISMSGFDWGLQEVRDQLGLTARAIRYYEDCGLVESRRDRMNHRRYPFAARARLKVIMQLRGAGVGIDELLAIFDAGRRDGPAEERRLIEAALNAGLQRAEASLAAVRLAIRELQADA